MLGDLDSLETIFTILTVIGGDVPLLAFAGAVWLSNHQKKTAAKITAVSGLLTGLIGMIVSFIFLSGILDPLSLSSIELPIPNIIPVFPLTVIKIDPLSGSLGAILACLFIFLSIYIVVIVHKFDLTSIYEKLSSTKFAVEIALITGISYMIGVFINIKGYPGNFMADILTSILQTAGVVISLVTLFGATIAMARMVYGLNYIKQTNSGAMYKGIFRSPPNSVSLIPKIYCYAMGALAIIFMIYLYIKVLTI